MKKLHEFMTPEEIKSVFHCTSKAAVPDYQLVSIHQVLEGNKIPSKIKLQAFGRQIHNLSLNAVETNNALFGKSTPVYEVTTDDSQPRGLRYTLIDNVRIKKFIVY